MESASILFGEGSDSTHPNSHKILPNPKYLYKHIILMAMVIALFNQLKYRCLLAVPFPLDVGYM